jgi:tRNA(adenine34) deaminase
MRSPLALFVTLALIAGCATAPAPRSASVSTTPGCVFNTGPCSTDPVYTPTPQQVELDNIYTLLAYAVVYKNWQAQGTANPRGYNIGSVLVDPQNNVVCWAVNSVDVTSNGTQHGEVRLMTNYLNNTRLFNLKGYAVYTSLEPCAMCSGMMTLQVIAKTIYGQRDPDFGNAIQRLELNSSSMPGGYCPYPRAVISVESQTPTATAIDQAYCTYYNATQTPSLTQWLASPTAQALYAAANTQFASYQVQYPANQPYLTAAQSFLASVPSTYTPTPYTVGCTAQ